MHGTFGSHEHNAIQYVIVDWIVREGEVWFHVGEIYVCSWNEQVSKISGSCIRMMLPMRKQNKSRIVRESMRD